MHNRKPAGAGTLPLMGALDIWSISTLPDMQMNVNPGTPPAPATVDPPVTPPVAAPTLNTTDAEMASWPPEAIAHVRELRREAQGRRHETNDERKLRMEAEIKLATLETEKAELVRKDLEAKQEYQKLYEAEKAETAKMAAQASQREVNDKIKIHALANGYTAKDIEAVQKLIDKNGVTIDAAGNVTGIDGAFERLKSNYGHLFVPPTANTGTPPTTPAPADPKQPTNPADDVLVPGSFVTYGQLRALEMANSGKAPTPGTPPPAKAIDLRKATKEEAAAWRANFHSKLPKNDGR